MIETVVVELVKNHPDAIVPYQTYHGDAGFDLACYKEIVLDPFSLTDISMGVSIRMPSTIYGRITNRSSTERRWKLSIVEGIIDPSYIGELFIGIRNNNGVKIVIPAETRLAQIIFSPIITPSFVEVDELQSTARGKRGFGSTGM